MKSGILGADPQHQKETTGFKRKREQPWSKGLSLRGGCSVHEVPLVRVTRLPLIANRSKRIQK